jgi:hypothetical protein
MKKIFISRLLIFIFSLCFAIAFFCAGCKKSEQKPELKKQSAENEKESEKAPDELKDIESNIEKIISNLGGPASSQKESSSSKEKDSKEETSNKKEEKNSSEGTNSSEEKSSTEENKTDSQEKKQDEKSKGDEKQNESTKKETTTQDPWQQVSPVINKLHYDWSNYTPKAAKLGANGALLDNFGKALNNLTNSAAEKNMQNTLLNANYLYGYLPDFYLLYKSKSSPEIKRVRYYIRNSALNSVSSNWEQCDLNINSLKSSWSLYKNTLETETQEPSSKLEFSIYELEKVVNERNQHLIDIKARVALSNVDALEKAVEKGSGQSESRESEK